MGQMVTQLQPVNEESLALADVLLRQGQVVAFPTETVYGLGGWALSEEAASRIYEAKGRPGDNPLIVHIAPGFSLDSLVASQPPYTKELIEKFWPGPLTLIMPKAATIPSKITGGRDTVAIRMPAHPAALALLQRTGLPIAAPSANTSGKPSPTTAEHVRQDLIGKIPLIIDGGACEVGLESTVLDLTVNPPAILRPGAITRDMLLTVLPDVIGGEAKLSSGHAVSDEEIPKAPGMKYPHYAPKGHLVVTDADAQQLMDLVGQAKLQKKVGLIVTNQMAEKLVGVSAKVILLGDRTKPEEVAAGLFSALRAADEYGLTLIYGEALPETGLGAAIMNRFLKAASEELWLNKKGCGKDKK